MGGSEIFESLVLAINKAAIIILNSVLHFQARGSLLNYPKGFRKHSLDQRSHDLLRSVAYQTN